METGEVISLNALEIGRSAVLVRLGGPLRKKKKFADIGLVAGTPLRLEGKAPFGGLLRINVLGSSIIKIPSTVIQEKNMTEKLSSSVCGV